MPILSFKGKSIIRTHHLSVPYRQLEPRPRKSVLPAKGKPTLDDNLIIHGDNLEALKALLPSFSGRVKCIYIDPPYNTGNENWVYNDNVNSPMHQDWLKRTVDREDLTRHDKWLCMMWPRLTLLRDLLAEDGAIFISIDDNEVHHLRAVMDEIFGEQNFVASVVWQKKYAVSSDANGIPSMHDYIVVYQKSPSFEPNMLERTEKQDKVYQNPDNDPRGLWRPDNLTRSEYRERDWYPIVSPKTGKEFYPPKGASWRHPREVVEQMIADNRVWFGADGNNRPVPKRFLSEVRQGIVASGWWPHTEVGHNDESKKELQAIFDGESPFETPKPTRLIQRILKIATNEDSIILDSFAGSGTTAHAVLALNAEDEGNRRFILIEQEDYADSITAERVRRVIKGVPDAKDEKLKQGYGGTFSYFTLGPRLDDDRVLHAQDLPAYNDLARYVFFTTTGEQWDEGQLDERRWYVGESKRYHVYLIYQPDVTFIKNTPLNLDFALNLPPYTPNTHKLRLVVASHKYLDDDRLREFGIEFCQLPFSIYKFRA